MKGIILTSKEHLDFVIEVVRFNNASHDVTISTVMNIPSKYDFGISYMFLEKIPSFHVKNKPWFNFHPGPLPMYKGRNLCYHAIMNDEREFGATVHYMDENYDTGDIIEARTFPILSGDTAETLHNATMTCSNKLFIEYFPRIFSGEKFVRIPNIDGKYYYKHPIQDEIFVNDDEKRKIRAITFGKFYPKIDIDGVIYKIVRDK